MKVKPFCFHITEGANNYVKQGDACIFARNPIGVTHYRPITMFTSVFHDCLSLANKMPYRDYFVAYIRQETPVALTDSKVILSTNRDDSRRFSSKPVKGIPVVV